MKKIWLAICLCGLCGCAQVEFTPYTGAQQRWPVAPGSFVQSNFAVPVYLGAPDRPYSVIGYVNVENARTGLLYGSSQSIRAAAQEAANRGGDALILQDKGTDYAGSYSSMNMTGSIRYGPGAAYGNATSYGFSTPVMRGHASAVVIKFL